jgi:DNA-binding MarR family transcriptional regulator
MGFLLHDVSRLMRKNFKRRGVEGMALTQTHLRALAHLSRNEGLNQAALADILEIQPITLTRLIDRLEEADLVERRRDPDDRRAQRLFLTKAAAPIMEELWKMVADMHEEALAGLSTAVHVGIIKALQTMKNNLLQAEEEDAPDTTTRRGAAANAGNG